MSSPIVSVLQISFVFSLTARPPQMSLGHLWALLLASLLAQLPRTAAERGMHRSGRVADRTIAGNIHPPQPIPAHSKVTTRSAVVERRPEALGLVSIGAMPAENHGNCPDGRWTPAGRLLRKRLFLLIREPPAIPAQPKTITQSALVCAFQIFFICPKRPSIHGERWPYPKGWVEVGRTCRAAAISVPAYRGVFTLQQNNSQTESLLKQALLLIFCDK